MSKIYFESLKNVLTHNVLLKLCLFSLISWNFYCFAKGTGFSVPGTDRSDQLGDMQDMVATIVGILVNWVAKAFAGFLIFGGIVRCAKKRNEEGIPLLIGGVSLMFLPTILDALSGAFGKH